MKTLNSRRNVDLKEISLSELNAIKGSNAIAFGGLLIAAYKLAMDTSYNIGYAIGYYAGG